MWYSARRQFAIVVGTVAVTNLAWILTGNDCPAQTKAGAPALGEAIASSAPPATGEYVDFAGRTEAMQTIEVRHPMPGLLTKIVFREGQDVRQGDLLFEFDPRPHQATLELTRAEQARAQTELAGAEADFARQKQTSKAAAVSQAEIDKTAIHVAVAKAAVQAAEAKLRSAQLNLESTRIVSPITGRIGRAYVSAGNCVPPNTILAVIVSEDPIRVSFAMDEKHYHQFVRQWRPTDDPASPKPSRLPVKIGLSIEQDFPHEGVIDFFDNHFDPATGTINVYAVFPNADHLMLPGLFVRVRMPLATPRRP